MVPTIAGAHYYRWRSLPKLNVFKRCLPHTRLNLLMMKIIISLWDVKFITAYVIQVQINAILIILLNINRTRMPEAHVLLVELFLEQACQIKGCKSFLCLLLSLFESFQHTNAAFLLRLDHLELVQELVGVQAFASVKDSFEGETQFKCTFLQQRAIRIAGIVCSALVDFAAHLAVELGDPLEPTHCVLLFKDARSKLEVRIIVWHIEFSALIAVELLLQLHDGLSKVPYLCLIHIMSRFKLLQLLLQLMDCPIELLYQLLRLLKSLLRLELLTHSVVTFGQGKCSFLNTIRCG